MWFWFDREWFLNRNWNVSNLQWIWNRTKHILKPYLVRWNVSDSCLNHLDQFEMRKSKHFIDELVWNILYFSTMKRQNRCFKWFWFTSFSFLLNLKHFNKRAKRFYKVILIREPFLERNWNVSDSQWIWNRTKRTLKVPFGKVKRFRFRLESLGAAPNGKNRNISEVNRFETFQFFVLQPWNGKIGVLIDSLPSHFH
jgi:hypothetical protein